jgi:type IV pilus assembly protein PilA
MLQKMTRTNEKGFTLIELMIVIAIIGILAAIAIPNFISYRNKSFCSAAETDANNIAAAIANYFAIPTHTALPTLADLKITSGTSLSNKNTTVNPTGTANTTITIVVTDATGRCPADYQSAMSSTANPKSFWVGGAYTKLVSQ